MREVILNAVRTSGTIAAVVFAGVASAQAPLPKSDAPPLPIKSQVVLPPAVARQSADLGRIEIYEGARRTVYYVAAHLSVGERSALQELARAENESAYAGDLLALKREYVDSERVLEPYRRSVQQQLYGISTETTDSASVASGYGRGGYYPYAFANPYFNGFGGGYFGGATTTVSRSLANGVGYEGPLKDAMAKQIATEASPEFAGAISREYDVALGRAASSERLANAFGVTRSNVVPAATNPSRIQLTLKSGEKLDGNLYGEDSDWFRVETATGTVSVRKAEVTRVEVPKK
jgi:hypothetical protein